MILLLVQAEELAAAMAASKGHPAQTDNDVVRMELLIYGICFKSASTFRFYLSFRKTHNSWVRNYLIDLQGEESTFPLPSRTQLKW